MSPFVVGGSILASFLAGGLALFAPCCITFLLPAYFASAFRQRRGLLAMTFVFAAGMAMVLVPIALGLAALSQVFSRFHQQINIVGGAFLISLGILALAGKGLMLPMPRRPDLRPQNALSVMSLGIFSGVASSCCAPVLVGVLTLTALSPSVLHGFAVSLAYVAGMVLPLLLLAYFWDERRWANSALLRGKTIRLRLGQAVATVHSTNLVAGVIFVVMGAVVLAFGLTGGSIYAPRWQTDLGVWLSRMVQTILTHLSAPAQTVAGAALLVLVGALAIKAFRRGESRRREIVESGPAAPEKAE